MTTASWLDWTERETLARHLEALAEHFPARQDFDVWRAGVLGAFIGGGIAFVETARGGWLLQGGEGFWGVIATVGALDGADLRAAFAAVQAESRLVVWDEEVGEGWTEALAAQGALPYVRQTFVQALEKVHFKAVPEDGLQLTSYDESPLGPVALDLLAAGNAESLEGMFLTLPLPPTLENCQRAIQRMRAGEHGEFLPWASFVAAEGDRVLGTLVCVVGDHDRQGMLFDLYVDPAARGRQLSRRLVMAMQQALLARGFTENHFLTMGANAPVHRLFTDDEIADVEETRGGYWQRA